MRLKQLVHNSAAVLHGVHYPVVLAPAIFLGTPSTVSIEFMACNLIVLLWV